MISMASAAPQTPSSAVPTELVAELRVVTQLPARGMGTNLPQRVSAWKTEARNHTLA